MLELSSQNIANALKQTSLFEGKNWVYSPDPFYLSKEQVVELEKIGEACLKFYEGLNLLYNKIAEDKPILRNGGGESANWVLEYLQIGKPDFLLSHASSGKVRSKLPPVIRPDLLLTNDGFVMTELDSVPGGIGLTAFLYQLYGDYPELVGSDKAIFRDFLSAMRVDRNAHLIIAVSKEASTYKPEMEWLVSQLSSQSKIEVVEAEKLDQYVQEGCVVYRFWELFDLENLPAVKVLFEQVENGTFSVTPPMKPQLEEKMGMALYHHPRLNSFWHETINKRNRTILDRIVPKSWILDPTPVAANAILLGPEINGSPISNWSELKNASKKDRNLILKRSGFSEDSWGSRSVSLGSDLSQLEWGEKLEEAIAAFRESPFIVQDFKKPILKEHRVYDKRGEIVVKEGRTRLCPYYFVVNGHANLSGVLATFCPSDKKIIHGMSDAALLPCAKN